MTYVTVHVVGVDCIATFLVGELDSFRHNVSDIFTADVEPFLIAPAVQCLAHILGSELARVWSIWFVRAATEIAYDFLA